MLAIGGNEFDSWWKTNNLKNVVKMYWTTEINNVNWKRKYMKKAKKKKRTVKYFIVTN